MNEWKFSGRMDDRTDGRINGTSGDSFLLIFNPEPRSTPARAAAAD